MKWPPKVVIVAMPLRSLNSRWQARQRKRRYPSSVRSRRSTVVDDSQCGHRILPSLILMSIPQAPPDTSWGIFDRPPGAPRARRTRALRAPHQHADNSKKPGTRVLFVYCQTVPCPRKTHSSGKWVQSRSPSSFGWWFSMITRPSFGLQFKPMPRASMSITSIERWCRRNMIVSFCKCGLYSPLPSPRTPVWSFRATRVPCPLSADHMIEQPWNMVTLANILAFCPPSPLSKEPERSTLRGL